MFTFLKKNMETLSKVVRMYMTTYFPHYKTKCLTHLEVAPGQIPRLVRGHHRHVLKRPRPDGRPLRHEGHGHFPAVGVGRVDLAPQLPEVDLVGVVLVDQLNDEGLRALERGRRVVGDGDVDLADGDVAVKVVGVVLHHHVLEGGHGHDEAVAAAGGRDGDDLHAGDGAGVVAGDGGGEVDGLQAGRALLDLKKSMGIVILQVQCYSNVKYTFQFWPKKTVIR